MLDKLKFWKQEEQVTMPNLGERLGLTESFGGIGAFDFKEGLAKPPSLEPVGAATISSGINSGISAPQAPTSFGQSLQNTDAQLISAKLDTIKALLDNVSVRLARIEQMADDASREPAQPSNKSTAARWNY